MIQTQTNKQNKKQATKMLITLVKLKLKDMYPDRSRYTHKHIYSHTVLLTDIYFIYMYINTYSRLKKTFTVYLPRKCLRGLDIKQRRAGNYLDVLILVFLKKYLWYHPRNLLMELYYLV